MELVRACVLYSGPTLGSLSPVLRTSYILHSRHAAADVVEKSRKGLSQLEIEGGRGLFSGVVKAFHTHTSTEVTGGISS